MENVFNKHQHSLKTIKKLLSRRSFNMEEVFNGHQTQSYLTLCMSVVYVMVMELQMVHVTVMAM
jgi:hypothetical protein